MAEKSIGKNYIYNLLFQILTLITPFITTPYLSRVLGVEGIGLNSYCNSMVFYFTLIAALGTTAFGQREVAGAVGKEARSRSFWEVFSLRIIFSVISLAIYLVLFTVVFKEHVIIYLILALNVVSVFLDISWFFQGVEEFGMITLRNSAIKILGIIATFAFIKTPDDLVLYILITAGFTAVGNLSLWIGLPKHICKVKDVKPFRNIKTVLQFFIPTVAVQIYTVLDKSMIGWFTAGSTFENGYYEQAEKLVKMALTVVTAINVVFIPKLTRCFREGDMDKVRDYSYKSYRFIWFLGIPIFLGIFVVADYFVPIFYGAGYEKCTPLIRILSLIVLFIGTSAVTGTQYFVSVGKQNILTLTVTIGAVVNVMLNLILIPHYYSVGASIATVVAEFVVALFGIIYVCKKDGFKLSKIFVSAIKYLIAGGVMFLALYFIKKAFDITVLALILLVVIGVSIYFVCLLLLKDKFLLDILNKVLGKFIRKKNKAVEENNEDN